MYWCKLVWFLLLLYAASGSHTAPRTASPIARDSVRKDQRSNSASVAAQAALTNPSAYSDGGISHRTLQAATPAGGSTTATAVQYAHKQLLPLSARDVLLFLLASTTLALAAASGIGGGVLLVPLLSMVGGFQFIEAVALSNAACLAGAITNLMFNITRRNPVRPGPLIDYDLLLLFGPPVVMGSVAGAKVNYFIPSWITKTLLLGVLAPMALRMVKKAKFLWVAESKFKSQARADIQAAAADDDVDDADVKGAAAVGDQLTQAVAAAETQPACQISAPGANLLPQKLPAAFPKRVFSAAAAAAIAAPADEPEAGLRRAYSDDKAGLRARLDNSSRSFTRPLRQLASSTSLVDILGPELMLLTSPAAATAAVQVQHVGRELLQQHSSRGFTRGQALLSSLSALSPGSSGLERRSGTSRSHSMFTTSRQVVGRQASDAGPRASRGSRACVGDVLTAAASGDQRAAASATAAGGADNGPFADPSHCVIDIEAGDAACDQFDPASGVKRPTLDILSPFALHQQGLPFKQKPSFKRFGSSSRQGSMRARTSVSRSGSGMQAGSQVSGGSSLTAAGSSGGHVQATFIRQQLSCDEEEHVRRAVDIQDVAAAAGQGAAGGEDAGLPLPGVLRCWRLSHEDCCHTAALEDSMSDRIKHHASNQYPKIHLAALLGLLLVVVATTVCSQLLQCGTWQYWMVACVCPILIMAVIWGLARWHVLWRVGWQECLELMDQTEIAWTRRNTLLYPAICISVGLLAGLLGVSGGTVLAPMLLELGVHPQISAASSQAAILISTATAAVIYLVNGSVPPDYGISFVLIGLFATLLGQTAITCLVRRTGRNSLLVFILAALFVAALGLCFAAVGVSIAGIVKDPLQVTATRKHAICPSHTTL